MIAAMPTFDDAFRRSLESSGTAGAINVLFGRLQVIEFIVSHLMRAAACETKNPTLFINELRNQLVAKLDNLPEEARPHAAQLIERLFVDCAAYIREYQLVLAKETG